jgi:predicted GNAT family N-acyltransferase
LHAGSSIIIPEKELPASETLLRGIQTAETYELRHTVLRPNQALAECQYPLDNSEGACHMGYFVNGTLVGVGTIFREDVDGRTDRDVWRIRGMAVAQEWLGKGVGGKILTALIAHAAAQNPEGKIWCNGRATVRDFYTHFGFLQLGDAFELPHIGLHVVLVKILGARASCPPATR